MAGYNRIIKVIVFLLLLMGCSENGKTCQVNSNEPPKFQQNKSGQVFIFIDGTSSMRGFVKSPFSRYVLFISNLESAINATFPTSNIHYFKFGSDIEEISREYYKQSLKPEFYGKYSSKSENITNIDVVLKSIDSLMSKNNEVFIIVTDLFQDDSDIDKVISSIKDLKSRGAYIGIVAQRSKFDGRVYDVSEYKYSFRYSGVRPFYAIFISKNPINIINIIHNIKNLFKNFDNHVLLFGDTLFYRVPEIELKKLSKAYKLSSNKLKVKSNSKIELSVKVYPLEFSAYYPDSILFRTYSCKDKKPVKKVAIISTDFLNENATVKLKIDKLETSAVVSEFSILSRKIMPKWIDEYDMDINDLEKWLSDPESFPGHTTYNLKKFFTLLYSLYDPFFGNTYLILVK